MDDDTGTTENARCAALLNSCDLHDQLAFQREMIREQRELLRRVDVMLHATRRWSGASDKDMPARGKSRR